MGYLANIKGAYTEFLAKGDTIGDTIKDLKHVNKGGLDYVALDGNTLKMVEAKARKALSRSDIENYIKPDKRTGELGFNAEYVIKDLGEEYFKDKTIQKQFVLYLNGPESTKIMNNLNLPASVPYKFTRDGVDYTGTVEIIVKAVNK